MNFAQGIDFNSLMEPVALRLLGEPAQKHGREWRYGNRGSLSIDLAKGHWFDHEANTGGGVFDLIKRRGHEQPAAWLRREGLLATPQPQPRIVKTYGYCDENGTLLFQVVRFEPKRFSQRRPDGRDGWIWNLQDTRRVPYLLPELVKAVAAGETIYVPEGAKDVDNLRAIGFAATTNPGGCKKWRSEYSEHLRGADVVVMPDNHLRAASTGTMWPPPSAASLSASAFSISASIGPTARQGRHFRLARRRPHRRGAREAHRDRARLRATRGREKGSPAGNGNGIDDAAELERLARLVAARLRASAQGRRQAARHQPARAARCAGEGQARRAWPRRCRRRQAGPCHRVPDARAVARAGEWRRAARRDRQGNRFACHHARAQPRRLRAVGRSYLSDSTAR